ncbi:cobyrinate a,c-diamide synthase [Photobacterium sanguinicancri]|uniref:cobyrinate a,c-diamide synthase n=1 Tax=Photobacterium sanguinicancri TaxID=875932 RepID=UPI002480A6C5|nr:cobyrinate a,c-diamide synthase [Photobacterium sanguinicancri]
MSSYSCPALVVAAPASGTGKTTVVAALARYFTQQGKKVRVFKTGPDFIDPQFLALASKAPVYQLDFWMCGEAHCRNLLAQASQEADLILIEGVMGMFDGQCSSADIAAAFGIPILAVIDAGAMAQTFGAIAHGLASYRQDVDVFGVIANRVGSERHAEMLQESLRPPLTFCGWLPKDMDLALPERHLGLVQASELDDIEARLDHAASVIAASSDIPLPKPIAFDLHDDPCALNEVQKTALSGVTVAVAKDNAFLFLYQANLELLEALGADLVYFSPLTGTALPCCDALYLPGGYPELHLDALHANQALITQIQQHVQAGKPCVAECGGMLYLNKTLTAVVAPEGESETARLNTSPVAMCGVLNAHSRMQPKLAALGIVEAAFELGTLRGHTFHYSMTSSEEEVLTQPVSQYGRKTDPVWTKGATTASYIHWYFPSNPDVVVWLFTRKAA